MYLLEECSVLLFAPVTADGHWIFKDNGLFLNFSTWTAVYHNILSTQLPFFFPSGFKSLWRLNLSVYYQYLFAPYILGAFAVLSLNGYHQSNFFIFFGLSVRK